MSEWDVIILGAGAAGLFCAGTAVARGRRVVVIDHARAAGEKIRISGGGRCNFTNLAAGWDMGRARFLSANPRFAASALTRFGPRDFLALVEKAGIAWHEKAAGQLFCDGKATQITDMLIRRAQGMDLRLSTTITAVTAEAGGFAVATSAGVVRGRSVVVATGGKSIPKMGATGFGMNLAGQFGLPIVDTRPGLVPLTFAEQELAHLRPLAGVSVPARVSHGKTAFEEPVLMTHRGLSGPAILQISNYWREGDAIEIDLTPDQDVAAILRAARTGRVGVGTVLSRLLPDRLAQAIVGESGLEGARLADQSNRVLDALAERIRHWRVKPVGSEGYRTAEVMLGGVDTRALDAKTMAARDVPGLYFIGEVVDVTGWLGGYNFQWAWASGHAAGLAV